MSVMLQHHRLNISPIEGMVEAITNSECDLQWKIDLYSHEIGAGVI